MNAARLTPAELQDVARDLRMRQEQILDRVSEMDTDLVSMKSSIGTIANNTDKIAQTLEGMGAKLLTAVTRLIYAMGAVLGIVVILAVSAIMRVAFVGDSRGISINPQSLTVQAAPVPTPLVNVDGKAKQG